MKISNILLKAVVYILVVLVSIGILFPVSVMVSSSLKSWRDLWTTPATWIPNPVQLDNYVRVWQSVGYGLGLLTYFRNSLIIACGTTLVTLAISLPAAYSVSRFKFKGRKAYTFLILTSQMITPAVMMISLFRTMKIIGLLNTYLSVILVISVFAMAYTTWILIGTFDAVPIQLDEAAMVDGCSRFHVLTKIIIPLAAPGIVTAAIYAFIYAWSDFIISLTFLRSRDLMPVTVGLNNMIYTTTGRETPWNDLMAASVLSSIPVIVLFSIIRRYMIKGLTAGAIKG